MVEKTSFDQVPYCFRHPLLVLERSFGIERVGKYSQFLRVFRLAVYLSPIAALAAAYLSGARGLALFLAGAIVGLYVNGAAAVIRDTLRAIVELAQRYPSVHPLRTWRAMVTGGGISTTSGEQLSAFAINRLQWSIRPLGRQWQHAFHDMFHVVIAGRRYRYSRPAALKYECPRRPWQKTRLYRWWNRWAATRLLRRTGRLLRSGRVALFSEIGNESIHDFDDPAFTLAYALDLRYYRGFSGRRKSELRIAATLENAKPTTAAPPASC